MRSYLYAADLTVWLWTLLFKAPCARAYNVGSGEDMTIKTLAAVVAKSLGATSDIHVAQTPDPSRPISRYVPSVSRAASELGLVVLIPLQTAVARTAAWHRCPAG